MPKKISVKTAATRFTDASNSILTFFKETAGLKETHQHWCADYAAIRLYREFETLMLESLSGSINNDSRTISSTVGCSFPKHMSRAVCQYLIVGTGYFDFHGRDGLIQTVKGFIPDDHYLTKILKKPEYKDSLERLSAIRNFAAHDSDRAKEAARRAIGGEKMGSAGYWLRKADHFEKLVTELKALARDIERDAPY
jgi:hypothetical protein